MLSTRSSSKHYAMELKSTVEVAAAAAGLVSTILEIQRRVSDYRLDSRTQRLRARAEELTKFLQIQTELHRSGADEQLARQAILSTKAELDDVLEKLVKVQQAAGATKVDEMSPIRRGLLLFVPARPLAWVPHFGFYFSVCFLGLGIIEIKEVSASKIVPTRLIVVEILSSAVVAVLLRYWALMEKRWNEGFRPTPSPASRHLLWYRPASRRELMSRAALVFGVYQFGSLFTITWISPFRELFTFVQFSVTLIVFYAWSVAELTLATHPVEMIFPRNLRFLRWPHSPMNWFWTMCFYFMVGCTIFFIRQVATFNIVPAEFRKVEFLRIGAIIGLIVGFFLAYLLPMYALHRILLAQSEHTVP